MRRLQMISVMVDLLLLTGGVSAQVLPTKPQVETLKNGLTVVTVPWDSPGMVSYYSVVRTGSRDETDKGHTGFAHLFEHMMFRGTEKFPKPVYEDKIQEFGADNNAFTSRDLTCYTVSVPTEVLGELIEIEADRIQNLEYSQADFKTETGAVLGEYNMNASSPGLTMSEKLHALAFNKHTYGHTVIGFLEDVKAMPKYFPYSKRFHRKFYTPDNTTLVVVGDFDRDAVLEKIKAEYGKWKGKRRISPVKKELLQKKPLSVHVPWKGPTSPKMTIAYKIPAYSAGPDSAALEVLSHLVFGETSPLYRKLVLDEQKLLSLSAPRGGRGIISRDPYLFQVNATLKDGTTFDEIQEAVTQAIAEVANGQVQQERIQAVKSHVSYGFRLGLETSKNVAGAIAMFISATGDAHAIDKYGQALSEVTPEDISRVAREYLSESRRTVVTMAQEKGGDK